MNELRGGLVLLVAFTFLLIILGELALGTIMKPHRWCERPRAAA